MYIFYESIMKIVQLEIIEIMFVEIRALQLIRKTQRK